jgi:hypothetical protein
MIILLAEYKGYKILGGKREFLSGEIHTFCSSTNSIKVKVKQSRYRSRGPRGFQEVKVPRFHDTAQNSGKVVSLTHGHLYPRKYSWYSFVLEAESTPGP